MFFLGVVYASLISMDARDLEGVAKNGQKPIIFSLTCLGWCDCALLWCSSSSKRS